MLFGLTLSSPNFSKFCPHLHRCNCVRVHPYDNPQHKKWLKHLTSIKYGSERQSGVVYSLQTWHHEWWGFGLTLAPIFPNFGPTCTGVRVYWCTHMPIHSIWRCSNTFNTCNMDIRSRVGWFTASKHDTTMLYGLTLSPNFPKYGIWLHRWNCVRVHLYAHHPQHMKEVAQTLHKHLIWIWDTKWDGLQAPNMAPCMMGVLAHPNLHISNIWPPPAQV